MKNKSILILMIASVGMIGCLLYLTEPHEIVAVEAPRPENSGKKASLAPNLPTYGFEKKIHRELERLYVSQLNVGSEFETAAGELFFETLRSNDRNLVYHALQT